MKGIRTMSELRYYKLFHRTSAPTSPEFISVVEFGNDDEVYLKSEADKVIARQKYKRCLAMASRCTAERDIFYLMTKFAKVEFYRKWHKHWLELAEKFKPNKEADDGND